MPLDFEQYFAKGSIENGPRDHLVSSVRIHKTPAHWIFHIWNRGGKSGELTVNASDGPTFLDLFLPKRVRVQDLSLPRE